MIRCSTFILNSLRTLQFLVFILSYELHDQFNYFIYFFLPNQFKIKGQNAVTTNPQ